jgi:hypothetical protein
MLSDRNCEILTRTQAHGEIWRAALQKEATALSREHSRATEGKLLPMVLVAAGAPATGSAPHITPASLDDNELWVGHPPRDGPFPQTFLGRLLAELLRLSNPLIAAYDVGISGWLPRGDAGTLARALTMSACEVSQ